MQKAWCLSNFVKTLEFIQICRFLKYWRHPDLTKKVLQKITERILQKITKGKISAKNQRQSHERCYRKEKGLVSSKTDKTELAINKNLKPDNWLFQTKCGHFTQYRTQSNRHQTRGKTSRSATYWRCHGVYGSVHVLCQDLYHQQ